MLASARRVAVFISVNVLSDLGLQSIYDTLNTAPQALSVLYKQSWECQCQEGDGDKQDFYSDE